MERKFYKEIWDIRFKKMLLLEEQSVEAYQVLLEECQKSNKGHAVEPHLEKLISDEKRHALMVRDLLEILNRQE